MCPERQPPPIARVVGQLADDGSRARCFAEHLRIHALGATGGLVYSQMPRYATADGKGTNDAAAAQNGPNGRPLHNPARDIWNRAGAGRHRLHRARAAPASSAATSTG